MPRRYLAAVALCGLLAYIAGCAKGNPDFAEGKKAEALQDYDTALAAYNRALKADPNNSLYRIHADQMRFEAAQAHLEQGQRIREKGDLQMALAEFRKAIELNPKDATAHYRLGRLYDRLGKTTEAKVEYAIQKKLIDDEESGPFRQQHVTKGMEPARP